MLLFRCHEHLLIEHMNSKVYNLANQLLEARNLFQSVFYGVTNLVLRGQEHREILRFLKGVRVRHDFQELRRSPVGRVVVLDTRLHVLQFVEHCEHVDELAKRQEVSLRNEIFTLLGVTQSLDFQRKGFDGFFLKKIDCFRGIHIQK